jgi:Ca2+-binding RTX toxin-like protein
MAKVEGTNNPEVLDALDGVTNDNDMIWGFGGDDTIFGLNGSDILNGGGGADILDGGDGSDTAAYYKSPGGVVVSLITGVGTGGDANGDTLISIENLVGSEYDDVLSGDIQENFIFGLDGEDTLSGHGGDDHLYGNDDNDTLDGGNGWDLLQGGGGADTMRGGRGNDRYYVDDAGDVVTEYAGEGTDTVHATIDYTLTAYVEDLTLSYFSPARNGTGNGRSNTITGNDLDNVLSGRGGADTLIGGDGSDTLDGGEGADTMIGGDGYDFYVVDDSRDVVTEAIGGDYDEVHTSVSYSLAAGSEVELLWAATTDAIDLTGNEFENVILGNNARNTIDGGDGADTLIGFGDDDTYFVDDPDDEVMEYVGGGIDTVHATVSYTLGDQSENLTLDGFAARDGSGNDLGNVITGNEWDNVLRGLDGVDTLDGGEGVDTLDGGEGADTMFGGDNYDFYVVDNVDDVVIEAIGEGFDEVRTSVSYSLAAGSEVEVLWADTVDAVNLTGNELVNVIVGNAARNLISGGGDADTLMGRGGDDTYVVDNPGVWVREFAGEGTDQVSAQVSYTLDDNVEHLTLASFAGAINGTGNDLDNTITGNESENVLTGAGGLDTLDGGAGRDTMLGGTGDDRYIVDDAADVVTEAIDEGFDAVWTSESYALAAGSEVELLQTNTAGGTTAIDLTGNAFNNTIYGNAGQNTITGGEGFDEMYGLEGNDTFVWASTMETGATEATADVVGDFDPVQGDLIDLNQIDADETVEGNQDFTFVGADPFTAAGQVAYTTDGIDTFILLNTDADSDAEGMIRLLGTQKLDAGWLVL